LPGRHGRAGGRLAVTPFLLLIVAVAGADLMFALISAASTSTAQPKAAPEIRNRLLLCSA
jgi:hypothetical protein